ncbi:MAG: ABC transporter permease [Acidobacteriota bacterium]
MSSLSMDVRFGLRVLAKRPLPTVLAIVALALGIGANTAIFSVVHAQLLRALPYPDSERLVMVWNTYPHIDLGKASVSVPDYFDRRAGVDAFEESALFDWRSFNLRHGPGPAQRELGVATTSSLFATLGVAPAQGSVWSETEDVEGGAAVAVIGHRLWQRLGSDPALVGKDLRIDGTPHRVLGVMPEGFGFPGDDVQIWTPLQISETMRSDERRGHESWSMVARLRADLGVGPGLERAQQQIDAIHAANFERFPEVQEFWRTSGFGGVVVPLREEEVGDLRSRLLLLQAVVALVLLIACANVANLLLARLGTRRRELAVRTALGAERHQLARQILTESAVLALAGGALGLLVGRGGLELLQRFGLAEGAEGVGLDPAVLAFTCLLALVTALAFGLFPVVASWRTAPAAVMRSEGRGASDGHAAVRPRHLLVVAEVALATMLLAGAGLLVRSFLALENEDPGFTTESVLTAQVSLPTQSYPDAESIAGFYRRAIDEVEALPGVRAVGLSNSVPFGSWSSSGSYDIEGREWGPGGSPAHSFRRAVNGQYFDALGIELLRGRVFDETEERPVAVIDRLLADKYFVDEDPIGRRLLIGGRDASPFEIVGVVETIKERALDEPAVKETIYVPYHQIGRPAMAFLVAADIDAESLTGPVREAIARVDPEQAVFTITTLSQRVDGALAPHRSATHLLVAFAALAAILAAVGLYGVLAVSVARRVRELGTRVALGAEPGDILGMVLRQGLSLAGAGAVVGIAGSLALGRFVASQLFEISPQDPATLGAAVAMLLLVAVVACLHPAWRATRISPLEALREE